MVGDLSGRDNTKNYYKLYSLEVKVIIEMIAWTQDDSIMALSFTYIHTFIHKTYKGGDPSGLTTTYDWFYMFSNTKLSALY